jgi:hypothetical protein
MKAWQKRIEVVLGNDTGTTSKNARRYCEYLKKNLTFPIRVTGIEDFPWEEPYVMGGGDDEEYEELKKTKPSYTDTYDLLDILEPETDDLIGVIKRHSDGRTFSIELSWLRCIERKSPAGELLKDYSLWYVNS